LLLLLLLLLRRRRALAALVVVVVVVVVVPTAAAAAAIAALLASAPHSRAAGGVGRLSAVRADAFKLPLQLARLLPLALNPSAVSEQLGELLRLLAHAAALVASAFAALERCEPADAVRTVARVLYHALRAVQNEKLEQLETFEDLTPAVCRSGERRPD
jgi:hypothetical protein